MTSNRQQYQEKVAAFGRHVDVCGQCAKLCEHAEGSLCETGAALQDDCTASAAAILSAKAVAS